MKNEAGPQTDPDLESSSYGFRVRFRVRSPPAAVHSLCRNRVLTQLALDSRAAMGKYLKHLPCEWQKRNPHHIEPFRGQAPKPLKPLNPKS